MIAKETFSRATHQVINQPPPLEDYNIYETDKVLKEALRREGAARAEDSVSRLGALVGSRDMIEAGFQANRFTPALRTHDRFGHRIDEVEYHPAYHRFMQTSMKWELHSLPWRDPRAGSHVARSAMMYLVCQTEPGHLCPISMTFASVPTLRHQAELAAEWEPRLFSSDYDERFLPASMKRGATIGMAMTEKQGGSDVRANTTRAKGRGGPGAEYEITGHKWFCSAPMCDAFLTLAHTDKGLSCFLVPRWIEGERNRILIQRLKDKLGNRSNASSEIEYDGARGRMVGEEGRGVATIIEMVAHTRLDCAVTSAALMRQALTQAIHHASHRSAFGKLIADQPLMQNVLADLALEVEAATVSVMRLARAYDEAQTDEGARSFRRLATAVLKYWICKQTPGHVYESLECLGGNGYVEESLSARLYREAPLGSIWEGSGNVICLDVLRAMEREPQSVSLFIDELELSRGANKYLDEFIAELKEELSDRANAEQRARVVTGKMALALECALIARNSPSFVSDAFCESRLKSASRVYGALSNGVDFRSIIERASV
ncbi:MAG: acyl-CoA dehydrogenase family protein [Acidobacteriota bacterium]